MSKKVKQDTNIQVLIDYRNRGLTPSLWINQADELIEASKKLELSIKKYWVTASKYFDPNKGTYSPPAGFKPKILLQATYFMLVAYAIENYFKAILVSENQKKYSQEILHTRTRGKLPKELKSNGHDLINLISKMKSKLDFTNAELSLLNRLFRHSAWQGRYPIPVKADELNTVGYNGKSFDMKTIGLWCQDINDLKSLIRRIKKFVSAKALASKQ